MPSAVGAWDGGMWGGTRSWRACLRVTFELSSKGWGGDRSIPGRGNSAFTCPVTSRTKDRPMQAKHRRKWGSHCQDQAQGSGNPVSARVPLAAAPFQWPLGSQPG